MLKAVVFPAPLGPMTATISPSPAVRLTPSSAVSPPNAMERSSTIRRDTLLGLEPVRQLLEVALVDLHPETLALRLVVGADRQWRQDPAVPALQPFQRGHECLAREVLAGSLRALGEEHRGDVA